VRDSSRFLSISYFWPQIFPSDDIEQYRENIIDANLGNLYSKNIYIHMQQHVPEPIYIQFQYTGALGA
jgi:hypothetical protein